MQVDRRALGSAAEQAVADYLVREGFTILWRNLRLGRLEIDIVAQKGELVAIVEVRTRGAGSFLGAFESISPSKRTNLLRAAARLWRERLSKLACPPRLRIDVAAVRWEGAEPTIDYAEAAIVGEP